MVLKWEIRRHPSETVPGMHTADQFRCNQMKDIRTNINFYRNCLYFQLASLNSKKCLNLTILVNHAFLNTKQRITIKVSGLSFVRSMYLVLDQTVSGIWQL